MKHWPRLTVSLPGPREFGRCCNCGAHGKPGEETEPNALMLWQECNDENAPEARHVWLCRPCSDKIIPEQERSYVHLHHNSPALGAMEACIGCAACVGMECTSPNRLSVGGRGVNVIGVRPTYDYRGSRTMRGGLKSKFVGWINRAYATPPAGCQSRTTTQKLEEPVEL